MIIKKIEPPYWYIGLVKISGNLQIMIYGEDLDHAVIETDMPHNGEINVVNNVDSHYLIIHIDVDKNLIKTGFYNFSISKPNRCYSFKYEIRQEERFVESTPLSLKDVVYLIMPDRFSCAKSKNLESRDIDRSNHHGWHGGNIQGVINHLDYLSDLGITALWLTPIVENKMAPVRERKKKYEFYHGYAATDFYSVDSHFGNLTDYQELVSASHSRGMKVVMDLVLNHCGTSHTWFSFPPMRNWFNEANPSKARKTNYRLTTVLDPYRSDADIDDTVKGWFSANMPDINLENKEVLHYFTQLALWWISTTSLDAIRVDTYPYMDLKSLKRWQRDIHKVYPKITFIAESWVEETAYTSEIQKRNSDGDNTLVVMDFAFQKHLKEMLLTRNREKASYALYNHFVYDYLYRDATKVLAFLDNHDMTRWAYLCDDIQKTKQAIGILLTVPRIPQIQYGTELLFEGSGGTDDGSYRQDFPGGWTNDECNKFLESGRTAEEQEVFDFTRRLLQWRKECKAITEGKMKHFIPQKGVYVYFRKNNREQIMVIVNCLNRPISIDFSTFIEKTTKGYSYGRDIITGHKYMFDVPNTINENELLILNLS